MPASPNTSRTTATEPASKLICPICGSPNACGAALAGTTETACWCMQVQIAPNILEKIPAQSKGLRCICQRCASGQVQAD